MRLMRGAASMGRCGALRALLTLVVGVMVVASALALGPGGHTLPTGQSGVAMAHVSSAAN